MAQGPLEGLLSRVKVEEFQVCGHFYLYVQLTLCHSLWHEYLDAFCWLGYLLELCLQDDPRGSCGPSKYDSDLCQELFQALLSKARAPGYRKAEFPRGGTVVNNAKQASHCLVINTEQGLMSQ